MCGCWLRLVLLYTCNRCACFYATRLLLLLLLLLAPAVNVVDRHRHAHHRQPGYCTHESTLQELAQRAVDPEYRGVISKTPPTPAVPLPDVSTAGSCNTYIPDKVLAIDRYLWTVQWFISNGFYVMIDW